MRAAYALSIRDKETGKYIKEETDATSFADMHRFVVNSGLFEDIDKSSHGILRGEAFEASRWTNIDNRIEKLSKKFHDYIFILNKTIVYDVVEEIEGPPVETVCDIFHHFYEEGELVGIRKWNSEYGWENWF